MALFIIKSKDLIGKHFVNGLGIQNRCGLVGEVIAQFWKYWIQYFAPSLVYQKKNGTKEVRKSR